MAWHPWGVGEPSGESLDDLISRLKAAQPTAHPFIHDVIMDLPKTRPLTVSGKELRDGNFFVSEQAQCRSKARFMNAMDGGAYGISVVVPQLVLCTLAKGHPGSHGEFPDPGSLPAWPRSWTIQIWDNE